MGDVEMSAALGFAIDLAVQQFFEGLEAVADFGMQPKRHFSAPTRNPLRSRQPPRCVLRLAAVSRTAAPSHPVGFENHGFDAELAGEENRAGKAGISRADDRDVGVDIA